MTTPVPTHCPSWCIEDHSGYLGGEIFHNGPRSKFATRHESIEEIYTYCNLAEPGAEPDEDDLGVWLHGEVEAFSLADAKRYIAVLQDAVAKLEEVAR